MKVAWVDPKKPEIIAAITDFEGTFDEIRERALSPREGLIPIGAIKGGERPSAVIEVTNQSTSATPILPRDWPFDSRSHRFIVYEHGLPRDGAVHWPDHIAISMSRREAKDLMKRLIAFLLDGEESWFRENWLGKLVPEEGDDADV